MSSPGDQVLHFGKHAGRTLDQVAGTDDGLAYLDWLVGQKWLRDPFKSTLEEYLSDESIQREIENL